ncbi:HNH endonuclease, partial [Lacticaseibacillus paracasei]
MNGVWPEKGIDHKNLNPKDNRFENLREADQSMNMANSGARRNNKSGFKGVHKHQRGWRAMIYVQRKKIDLGVFASP